LERGITTSRKKAQALIISGEVKADKKKVYKPSMMVDVDSKIEITERYPYVSRGGIKLKGALNDFKINVKDKICVDVGASKGGFTDCLLKQGAKRVFAIDVGTKQLDFKLSQNERVVNIEKTNIRYLEKKIFNNIIKAKNEKRGPDLVTIDVSFISLKKVLPKIKELIQNHSEVLALIKPQFEAEKKHIKKGVVKDENIQERVVEEIKSFSEDLGFKVKGITPSCLKGPKGNQEYFIYLKNIDARRLKDAR